MNKCIASLALALALAGTGTALHAQQVDYEANHQLAAKALAGQSTTQQAMSVAILVVNPQGGNPIQRAAHLNFFSGERFKLKILTSRAGTLQVVNLEQSGKENRLSSMDIRAGEETYYPADPRKYLEFDTATGNEILRLTLSGPGAGASPAAPNTPTPVVTPPAGTVAPAPTVPTAPAATRLPSPPATGTASQGASALFGNASGKAYVYGKGVREVVLENADTTWLLAPSGNDSLVYEMAIKHL